MTAPRTRFLTRCRARAPTIYGLAVSLSVRFRRSDHPVRCRDGHLPELGNFGNELLELLSVADVAGRRAHGNRPQLHQDRVSRLRLDDDRRFPASDHSPPKPPSPCSSSARARCAWERTSRARPGLGWPAKALRRTALSTAWCTPIRALATTHGVMSSASACVCSASRAASSAVASEKTCRSLARRAGLAVTMRAIVA